LEEIKNTIQIKTNNSDKIIIFKTSSDIKITPRMNKLMKSNKTNICLSKNKKSPAHPNPKTPINPNTDIKKKNISGCTKNKTLIIIKPITAT